MGRAGGAPPFAGRRSGRLQRHLLRFARSDYPGWAVLEWECALKDAAVGAAEGAKFIAQHVIKVTAKAFDDFADSKVDRALVGTLLGLN